ncbi:MAG TPA: hypothetical protein VFG68_02805 [Fimbriiglobus sp.]|nr:hypothetical protein [Fimbriiglobus sp.]
MRSMIFLAIGLAVGILIGACCTAWTAVGADPAAPAKAGEFSSVKIDQRDGKPVLDLWLDGKGRAVRFYTPEQKNPRTYFNDAGMLYTQGWVTISGTMEGDGDGYNIVPATRGPSMLSIWSDIIGPAIEVRTAQTDDRGSYLFQGLDRTANYVFSIEQNGALRWGASSRAAMDTNLYRCAAKTLKTDGRLVVADKLGVGNSEPVSTLDVKGSQSVQRTSVAADYTATDHDYYIGVTDTTAERRITLPPASGRAGRVYIIKDESGSAAVHPIRVRASAGTTIDGVATLTISTNYGVLRVISTGTCWFSM